MMLGGKRLAVLSLGCPGAGGEDKGHMGFLSWLPFPGQARNTLVLWHGDAYEQGERVVCLTLTLMIPDRGSSALE